VIKGNVMKKLISIAALSVLTACTAPQEASSIGNGAARCWLLPSLLVIK